MANISGQFWAYLRLEKIEFKLKTNTVQATVYHLRIFA